MPKYVDGFVLPIAKKQLAAYKKMAKRGCKVWMDHGALDYRECIGDDLDVKFGMPFPKGIRSKPDETIVFAFITYKSRAHRNKVNAAVMKDPRMNEFSATMPFDPKRMLYGGFVTIVEG